MRNLREEARCGTLVLASSHPAHQLLIKQVYAAGSEDMDTLTFNSPILYRHLTFSEARKTPISEINLERALEGLEMNMSQVRIPCAAI